MGRHTLRTTSPSCRATYMAPYFRVQWTYTIDLIRLRIISMFSMGRNGRMLISAAIRGVPDGDVSAFRLVDPKFLAYIMIVHHCSVGIFSLSHRPTVQKLFHVFHSAGNSHCGPKIGFYGDFWPLLLFGRPYIGLGLKPPGRAYFLMPGRIFKPLDVQIG